MKHLTLLFVVSLCIVSPVRAQARVYTNADLGRPLVRTRTPTAEEMQGLRDHQFTLSVHERGPKVFVLPYDPTWPFTYALRLEPDPWRTPGLLPFYSAWPFFGYPPNPCVIDPGPYAFDSCYTKPPVWDETRGPVDWHRDHVEHR
jgi:hypothetical protein